jgi:RHS repeat-associated protein
LFLTDGNGVVTDRYSYDAWGKTTHFADANSVNQPYQYIGQLGYYTHFQDPNMPLFQLGVREYDVNTGRFTQVDKVRDSLSLYVYANNNSSAYVDYDGYQARRKKHRDVNPDERDADIGEAGWLGTGCAYLVRLIAIRDMQSEFPGQDLWDDSPRNAAMHCYWAALIAAMCGRCVAVTVTNNHEKYNWNPVTGPMDLGNNKNGLKCFDNLKPGGVVENDAKEQLMKCCKKAKPVLLPKIPVILP